MIMVKHLKPAVDDADFLHETVPRG
jgi:hypothetical protein